MNEHNKNYKEYKTIGEVAKELNLVDKNTGQLQTHTIRFWETQFKEIKPLIMAGRRRYYSKKNIKLINYIKFLLKDKGLTIKGVKKLLKDGQSQSIDDRTNLGVYNRLNKSTKTIKDKLKNISRIIKEIKNIKNG